MILLRYDESDMDMSEDDQDELGKKFGLPVDQGGSKHSTRSVGRKNKKSRKKNPRKKQKKTKPGRKNKHRRPKRTSCSKDRLFLNFKELGWDVSITLLLRYRNTYFFMNLTIENFGCNIEGLPSMKLLSHILSRDY